MERKFETIEIDGVKVRYYPDENYYDLNYEQPQETHSAATAEEICKLREINREINQRTHQVWVKVREMNREIEKTKDLKEIKQSLSRGDISRYGVMSYYHSDFNNMVYKINSDELNKIKTYRTDLEKDGFIVTEYQEELVSKVIYKPITKKVKFLFFFQREIHDRFELIIEKTKFTVYKISACCGEKK